MTSQASSRSSLLESGKPPALMPRVNSDGNEMVGVQSTQHFAPIGAYTGWNIIAGGSIPFQSPRLSARPLAIHDHL